MFQYLQKPGSARFDPMDYSLPAPVLKFLSLSLLYQIPQFSEKRRRTFRSSTREKDQLLWIYLEKAMAPHSSTLAWKIPWTQEPGRLQSMGSLRVGLHFHFSLSCIGEGNGTPLQYSCLENPMDTGAWLATVHGLTESRTRLSDFTIDLSNP